MESCDISLFDCNCFADEIEYPGQDLLLTVTFYAKQWNASKLRNSEPNPILYNAGCLSGPQPGSWIVEPLSPRPM